ncbi:hypothetical protein GSI_04548 [Ganoderma sinense ZZ0214-1]|uniref:Tyr recombinase domain-containing protein n=1 Tax=Ganoderma sinense ZZ0214-1 TaxID=1077348 RepID=A0A2G8SH52_9APHY|nr:hypothetical protein GSI_04548 [Ganoderma sinense ZZ0214-1]
MGSESHLPSLAGALPLIEDLQTISLEDVQEVRGDEVDDIDNVAAELEAASEEEDNHYSGSIANYTQIPASAPVDPSRALNVDSLSTIIDKASEHVIVPGTRDEYHRHYRSLCKFCEARKLTPPGIEDWDTYWKTMPKEAPVIIVAWIMDRADDVDISTGEEKPLSIPRVSYDYAQKMRAAISHKFAREFKCGSHPWTENPLTGRFTGNPSLSMTVSQYMISLRRRRARAGEPITSARAVDSDVMKKLWVQNVNYPREPGLQSIPRKAAVDGEPRRWAGYKVRQMLQLLYILSFLCLLRYDEALKVNWSDIRPETTDEGICVVVVHLNCRKTNQTGGVAPFYLWPNDEKPWLCPVRAISTWWQLFREMNLEPKGRVFRSRVLYDALNYSATQGMSSASFLNCFRRNMVEVGIDPRPYGTHSFRRGGCQYLAMELRWPFRDICLWGGWAEDFDNPGTIFRYLLSWVDKPTLERKDFFNPHRLGTDPCGHCGRTCHCA